jgi:ribose/xylose/arabinose/galactoside ABC-type transport system permease subunit
MESIRNSSTNKILQNMNKKIESLEKTVIRYWAWFFLLLMLVIFSVIGQGFFSIRNFQNIIVGTSHLLIIALGWSFVLILGGMDLSVGYVMALVTIIVAKLMSIMYAQGYSETAILIIGLLVGAIISIIPGVVNGWLISRLKAPSFIVTLGIGGIARGLALVISGGMMIGNLPPLISAIGNSGIGYLLESGKIIFQRPENMFKAVQLWPFTLWPCLILLVITHFILSKTRFGRHVYAIGGNLEAAYRAGIPVAHQQTLVYILVSFLAGVSGLLYVMRFASAAPRSGDQLTLEAVAAVIIGGASLLGGKGTIAGALVGSLIIGTLRTGLVILGVQAYWQFAAVGLVVIAAVIIDQLPAYLRAQTKRKE